MSFVIATPLPELPKGTFTMVFNIVLSVAVMLIVLSLGLLLRRLLTRRLEKTILDHWAVETLGILAVIPSLVIGGIIVSAIWDNLFPFINDLRASHHIDLYLVGLNLAETAILVALSIGFARTVKKLTIRGLGEHRVDINTQTLLGRVSYAVVLTIAGFCIPSIWSVSIGIPVAAVGVLTLVITVAFQDIFKDLVAGFYLLLSRPFFIGDQISITIPPTVYVGKVENVELRATRIRLLSGEEVTIPNAIVFSNAVNNNTYFTERRATVAITVPVSDFVPQETAPQICNVLKSVETILLKPEPTVLFNKIAEEKVTLLARFWIPSDQTIDISEAMYALHDRLPNAELTIREPVCLA